MIHKGCGGTIIWAITSVSTCKVIMHSDNTEPDEVEIELTGTCEECCEEIIGSVIGPASIEEQS